jgi:hypothetical protein
MPKLYDISQLSEELRGFWSIRKRSLIKKWDFYYGESQKNYMEKFEGESEQEYLNRIEGATVENHCAKTCDVIVSYLYGQPNSKNRVVVRVTDRDGEINERAQRFLAENVWRYNNMDSFRVDVALMASVTGCGIVHKEFVDKRTMIPFPPSTSKEERKKYGTVRFDLFDTVDTMPLPYIGPTGVIYPRMLGAIARYYNVNNFSGISVLDRLLQKKYGEDEIIELYDNGRFVRARVVSGSVQLEQIESAPNPYNDINVPFTIFRNYGDPMYIEGISDLDQMISLQNTLNELNQADKATIDYHSYPLLVLTGGAKLPPNFIRKVNSGLELDVNQDVKYLVWDNVLEASSKKEESIRTQMTVVSGVSQISRGNASNIGQVRSGAGLKTLFQADINAIALKIPHFKEAERRLVYSTLAMWEKETGERFIGEEEEYFCSVEFPEDFVGLDELLKAQTEVLDLANGTRTIEEIALEKHPEIKSEAELEEFMKDVEEEKKMMAAATKPPTPPGGEGSGVKPPQTTSQKSNEQS